MQIIYFFYLILIYTFARQFFTVMSSFIEQYNILFKGLKTGVHNFSFTLRKRFFDVFENPDCHGGDMNVEAELDKKNHVLSFSLIFSGSINVTCDRCLEDFLMPVNFESNLFVKFGEEQEEADPDVIYLEPNEHKINLAEYLMESIRINLPIKKVHPKDKHGNDTCNSEMLERLNKHSVSNNKTGDPRWNTLKDMIDKKN